MQEHIQSLEEKDIENEKIIENLQSNMFEEVSSNQRVSLIN